MFVDAKIYYRGACPTADQIRSLEGRFNLNFVDVELCPFECRTFNYQSPYDSYIICEGNPGLPFREALTCSGVYIPYSVTGKWDISVEPGTHSIYCERGDYIVLTTTPATWTKWLFKKLFS